MGHAMHLQTTWIHDCFAWYKHVPTELLGVTLGLSRADELLDCSPDAVI